MPAQRRGREPQSLSHGRPSFLSKTAKRTSPSSKKSRSLIRSFHTLSKAQAAAVAAKDTVLAESIKSRIDAQGGLEQYQAASIAGQSSQRGGDSSKILMDWLNARGSKANDQIANNHDKLRMLEVGALSINNQCSRSGMFDVTRIDLNAQGKCILKQDFMQRPLPTHDCEVFDCVSLSLVLNYVPEASARGDMLKRVASFLCAPSKAGSSGDSHFPSLFLVLPAPCVLNSRYLDEPRLVDLMKSLGYQLIHRKVSAKLIYCLWRLQEPASHCIPFPKTEINPGKSRNNFAIVLN